MATIIKSYLIDFQKNQAIDTIDYLVVFWNIGANGWFDNQHNRIHSLIGPLAHRSYLFMLFIERELKKKNLLPTPEKLKPRNQTYYFIKIRNSN